MAFIENSQGVTYNPGYFLADAEHCTRVTRNFSAEKLGDIVTTVGSAKYVKAGSVYPKDDATAEGLVYEDVDVTNGEAAGSVVIAGTVYEDRLPKQLNGSKTHLTNITFIEKSPAVTRPEDAKI